MTRSEHLKWCKDRALKYLPDDPQQAVTSMMSDLEKHKETNNHLAINLGMMFLMDGNLQTEFEARRFIEGFN